MAKVFPIPDVLPVSPLSLFCPYCGAKPGKDCHTLEGNFAAIHLARIKAAAVMDAANLRKHAKD